MKKKNIYSSLIAHVNSWGRTSENPKGEMLRLLQFCVEAGINTFIYAKTEVEDQNEATFGISISESGLDRAEIKLISRYTGQNGFSNQKIIDFVDQTLLNLHTDYLDLLLLETDTTFSAENTKAIELLKSQGKINEVGASTAQPSQFLGIKNMPEAIELDFSNSHFQEWQKTLDNFKKQQINIFIKGFDADSFKTKNGQIQKTDKILLDLMRKYNANNYQLFLAWILRHSVNFHVILGEINELKAKNSSSAADIQLEENDFLMLTEALVGN